MYILPRFFCDAVAALQRCCRVVAAPYSDVDFDYDVDFDLETPASVMYR